MMNIKTKDDPEWQWLKEFVAKNVTPKHHGRVARLLRFFGLIYFPSKSRIHLPHRRSRTAPGGTPVPPDERAAARRLYPPTRVRAIPVEPPVLVNGSKPPKES